MKKARNLTVISIILNIYFFLIFCIYPLYVDDGYYNIGIAKIEFLYSISAITFFLLLITKILQVIKNPQKTLKSYNWNQISITERLLYTYMLIIIVSYLISPFKANILWGSDGWYLGTIPLLLMCSLVIFLIHNWKEPRFIGYGALIVSGFVFILGICHRFSFYPIRIEPTKYSEFISTLGNINWFCGYLSVISPIGVGLYVLQERKKDKYNWQQYLLLLYVFISFAIGFCQGSDSYFIWITALFATLLMISIKNTNRLKKYLLTVSLWGLAGQFIRIINYIFPERYNYDISTLNSTIDTNITLVIALIAVLLYFSIRKDKEIKPNYQKLIRSIVVMFTIAISITYIIASIYNTTIGISVLSNNSIFLWNESWGSGRGAIFKESITLFDKMNFIQKLFGVGADGFYAFAYSFPENVINFNNEYSNLALTNAHCEILTNLINLGIIGTITYIGILLSFFIRCIKHGEQQPLLYISALCTICYFSNNLVSFAQVLNIPFLFILIGISESYIKNMKQA